MRRCVVTGRLGLSAGQVALVVAYLGAGLDWVHSIFNMPHAFLRPGTFAFLDSLTHRRWV